MQAEIVDEPEPPRRELVLAGRAALADTGYNPDDYVDPETDRELLAGIPKNTLDAMEYQWGRFMWWCGKTGRNHLPATPATVRVYIRSHWEMVGSDGRKRGVNGQPYAPASVSQAVYVISMVHQAFGFVSPMRDPRVGRQLKRYEDKWKAAGYRERKAHALTHEESVRIARTCHLATVGGLRNACAWRLQFDTGARASEILALRMKDVRWEGDGRVVIHIARSKTGDARDVAVEAVPDVDGDVDPALLLERWVALMRERGFTDPDGPVFRQVFTARPRKDGRVSGNIRPEPWDYEDFEYAFVRAARRAGVDVDPKTGEPRHVTSHSNRAGHITEGVDAGVPLEKTAKRTGHSPASPVIHDYYRSGRRWGADNTGAAIRAARRGGE